ncbi:MAG: SCO1664 family protein [Anaerolineae bacterium]|nr:SCO1664 family protein [Anaerolineae bacterium]RIK22954.1 MAG: SCO1664 family protein [Anaerolineae bacterium]
MATGDVLHLMQNGTVEIEGLLPWSSNYTFLVRVCDGAQELGAVYKPQRGERPLWDFPQGSLCLRELAAFIVSEALDWHIVPPTVLREAQHGPGTIQLYIDHDPARHYFTIEGDETVRSQLQRIALLDIIINNADRKAGHVLIQEDGEVPRLWGIDHGICFHEDPKLRTVIWEFGGTPIPDDMRADLEGFRSRLEDGADDLATRLGQLLSAAETEALHRRLSRAINRPNFPQPGAGRHYPWPPV